MKKNILFLFSHADDETICAGGLINKLHCKSIKTTVATACLGSALDRKFTTSDYISVLKKQMGRVKPILGIDEWHVGPFDYSNLNEVKQIEVNRWVEGLLDTIKPDLVISHHYSDLHVDHRILHEAVKIATRPNGRKIDVLLAEPIYIYQENFRPNFYIALDNENVAAKMKAMSVYEKEIHPAPGWRSKAALKLKAQQRGMESWAKYAEAYEAYRIYEGW